MGDGGKDCVYGRSVNPNAATFTINASSGFKVLDRLGLL